MSHIRFSKPLWHLVDAKDKYVGRLASKITHILQGKHKPTFSPNYDCGDYVGKKNLNFIFYFLFIYDSFILIYFFYLFSFIYLVVINAEHVKFSGTKEKNYKYRWHTGYPGGLKEITPQVLREHKPEEVILMF